MSPVSVYQQLQESAKTYADKPFLHMPAIALASDADFNASFAETLVATNAIKQSYANSGLLAGDRVAILLENKPAFFFHWFALNALGICVVPVNGELMIDEASYLIDNSDARCVVGFEYSLNFLRSAVDAAGLSIPVVADSNIESLQLANEGQVAAPIDRETECAILYTSGSTGKPKGCLLSNDYFLLSGGWYRDATGYCQLEAGSERLITPLPLVHMNAMACSTMGMMMSGGCVIQLDRFHPRSWWQTVRDSGATIMHYLGVMPAILLKLDASVDDDFSSQVKFGFGAGVNPVHHQIFEERFGIPLIESWGMTETGAANCVTAMTEPRHVGTSCIGRCPDRLEIKLIDEAGGVVADGQPGELLVRAKGENPKSGFFSGYYKNEQATAEAWKGGWLHTGDIVRKGDDACYHFVDRLKNVIRRSGENISALEVEACLSLCNEVGQVGVTAVPDEIRGDEVIACIVLAADHAGKSSGFESVAAKRQIAESIFTQTASALAYYKLPGYVVFLNELPLTASNKPQRAELKKRAREIVANLDSETLCFDLRSMKKK